jgi:hypothetical protein
MDEFLGIHITAVIVKMPSYRVYWADTTRFAPITDVMPRNRFDRMGTFVTPMTT